MPSSMDYRIHFLSHFTCFQTILLLLFVEVFSMPIGNLVTTMGNLMSHHIILGPQVCLASYYDTLILGYHIVAFLQTVVMNWMPMPTLRPPNNSFMPISMPSMTNYSRPLQHL